MNRLLGGVIAAFTILGVLAFGAGVQHLYRDHQQLHAAIAWVAAVQAQAQQRQQQQKQQAGPQAPVEPQK